MFSQKLFEDQKVNVGYFSFSLITTCITMHVHVEFRPYVPNFSVLGEGQGDSYTRPGTIWKIK